ncbi:MAG: sigma-70 family RNA polymerase sigma factor [Planctomycetota bacterium]|nr:sigma-70 family RNA polymerase sigma factor [Planctomycetota bacterium]
MTQAPVQVPTPDYPDDVSLVTRMQAGDAAALEQVVREFGGRMLAVARRFLPDENDAMDAVQDGFLSACKSINRFEGGSRLETWLHRIVVNAALMKLRSRRRSKERKIDDLLPSNDTHTPYGEVSPWRSSERGGLDEIRAAEMRRIVQEKIDELPDAYRTVIVLRDIEGLDTSETARLLGDTENAIKTRLHRARLALRTLLDPYMRGESGNE